MRGETSPAVSSASEKPAMPNVIDQPRSAAISGTISTGVIEDRAPGQDLRDAEHQDGAPGAGDKITESGHHGGRAMIGAATLSRPRVARHAAIAKSL